MIDRSLLEPGSSASFSDEELQWVHLVPWGDQNVYKCAKCGWNVIRGGFGIMVPYEVTHDAVRQVVEHYKGRHR